MASQPVIQPIDRGWILGLGSVVLLGLITVVIFGIGHDFPASAIATGILVSGAALLLGALLGFLFGIPRAQSSRSETNEGEAPSKSAGGYKPNTNLEQISDWLTKILVGVGLTQLRDLPTQITSAAKVLGPTLGQHGDGVAMGIILYFPTVGFLFGFLWTRLFLAGSLARADLSAAFAAVEQKQQQQQQFDATALAVVQQHLSIDSNERRTPEEIKTAILKASPAIKVQVFYQAEKVRREHWSSDKALMERTIPIFEALIACDTERRFHKNHGQLGFALRDQRKPNHERAIEELTTAIDIRGSWQEFGWVVYEANRAASRMVLDPNFAKQQQADPSVRDAISADLKIAFTNAQVLDWFKRPPESDWLKINQISIASLLPP